jgi:uncharacterized membrane protein
LRLERKQPNSADGFNPKPIMTAMQISRTTKRLLENPDLPMRRVVQIKIFGVLGGAVVGATIPEHPIIGAAAGALAAEVATDGAQEAIEYVFDLGADLGRNWKPVVFGDWYSQRIARLLEEESP